MASNIQWPPAFVTVGFIAANHRWRTWKPLWCLMLPVTSCFAATTWTFQPLRWDARICQDDFWWFFNVFPVSWLTMLRWSPTAFPSIGMVQEEHWICQRHQAELGCSFPWIRRTRWCTIRQVVFDSADVETLFVKFLLPFCSTGSTSQESEVSSLDSPLPKMEIADRVRAQEKTALTMFFKFRSLGNLQSPHCPHQFREGGSLQKLHLLAGLWASRRLWHSLDLCVWYATGQSMRGHFFYVLSLRLVCCFSFVEHCGRSHLALIPAFAPKFCQCTSETLATWYYGSGSRWVIILLRWTRVTKLSKLLRWGNPKLVKAGNVHQWQQDLSEARVPTTSYQCLGSGKNRSFFSPPSSPSEDCFLGPSSCHE